MNKITNSNAYYYKPYKTATYPKKTVANQLLSFLKDNTTLIDLDDSYFIEKLYKAKKILLYAVIDNNALSFAKIMILLQKNKLKNWQIN